MGAKQLILWPEGCACLRQDINKLAKAVAFRPDGSLDALRLFSRAMTALASGFWKVDNKSWDSLASTPFMPQTCWWDFLRCVLVVLCTVVLCTWDMRHNTTRPCFLGSWRRLGCQKFNSTVISYYCLGEVSFSRRNKMKVQKYRGISVSRQTPTTSPTRHNCSQEKRKARQNNWFSNIKLK